MPPVRRRELATVSHSDRDMSRLPRRLRRVLRLRPGAGTPDDGSADLPPAVRSRFSERTGPAGLLVPEPVFVLSSVRSGSTLLQMILDSHSQIHAPHELHLASLEVRPTRKNAGKAMREIGLDEVTLANLLWDRVLHTQLVESGKSIIVDKTPNTTFQWQRVAAFWPRARPLLLFRHPLRVAESLIRSRPEAPVRPHYERVERYARALAAARDGMPAAHVLRYEDLTADPEVQVRGVCDWLGIAFEEQMLDYRQQEHPGQFRRGLGDWSETLQRGEIRPPGQTPGPGDVPAPLREACRLLGYPA